ncbi:MAG: ribonuclease III [Bacteroidaceae bacterium]|nr:ribonuclease III [Bacteroidaceae bacterium]
MHKKISNLLQLTYWKVSLLFKKDRKTYLSLYHNLGIMPNNPMLYQVALRHKSMPIIDNEGRIHHNERLEFLGDAIISLSVADYLLTHYKDAPEGMLTITRTKLVNRQYLNSIALELQINSLIQKKGRVISPKNNLYGNTLEAIIGAMYLDKGFKASRDLVVKWLIKSPEHIEKIISTENNYKARLTEWCQKNKSYLYFNLLPIKRGEHNEIIFEIWVYINNKFYSYGKGKSKKEAEQEACKKALEIIFAK